MNYITDFVNFLRATKNLTDKTLAAYARISTSFSLLKKARSRPIFARL